MATDLAKALVDFNEVFVLGEVRNRLDGGEDPISVIRELQEGMDLIGDRFDVSQVSRAIFTFWRPDRDVDSVGAQGNGFGYIPTISDSAGDYQRSLISDTLLS